MNYETIKNIPTSRNGKMAFGIFCAFIARTALNQGLDMFATDPNGAMFAFLMAGVLTFTVILAIVRYDSGRPLFEPLTR